MKRKLKELYRKIKIQYLGEKTSLIPEKYWSQFVCVGSASDWYYLFDCIIPKDKRKVLIVGSHGGRDYFYFKASGYEVKALDLFSDSDFGEVIVGNIEDIKLAAKSFDVIVASAVIEHLKDDYGGLQNIRRILKDDGMFIICNPLYNDWEITHMHIYSEKSLKRLVEFSGFRIDQSFGYPNLFFYPPLWNNLIKVFNLISFFLFKKTIYPYILPLLHRIEFFLSKQQSQPFKFMRAFLGMFYNGTLLMFVCSKGEAVDHLDFNKVRFDPAEKKI